MEQKKSALPVWSMILGIIGLIWVPGFLFGVAAVVTGIISVAKHKLPKGKAIAGIIMGAIAATLKTVLAVVVTIIILISVGVIGSAGLASLALANSDYDDYSYDYDDEYLSDYDPDTDEIYSDFYDEQSSLYDNITVTMTVDGVTFVVPPEYKYEYGDNSYMVFSDEYGQYEFPSYVYDMDGYDEEVVSEALYTLTQSTALYDGDIYYYNDEWDISYAEGSSPYNEYQYWIFAFDEDNDVAVAIMTRPYEGCLYEAEDSLESLLDHMYVY